MSTNTGEAFIHKQKDGYYHIEIVRGVLQTRRAKLEDAILWRNSALNGDSLAGYDKHVQAAHLVAVQDGGTEAVTNGRPLCPNCHWEYDHDLLEVS
jgi:predicted restriction endonuclease